MASIRVLLPPLRALAADTPLPVAVGEKAAWRRVPPLTLAELGRRWPGARVTAFLHPEDITLTAVALPPLPRARLRIAVEGAIEPLALGEPDTLLIGHGVRGPDGRVPVAWLDADVAQAVQTQTRACGLALAALAPATLWLPETEGGWTLWQHDGYLVVRQAEGAGVLTAWEEGDAVAPSTILQALGGEAPGGWGACRWVGVAPPGIAANETLPDAACGVTAAVSWFIAADHAPGEGGAARWRPAVALVLAAALVWLAGLCLYAWRLDEAAHEAREQLAQSVRKAFPSVGAVVDPVGQARRQLAARQGGRDDWAELSTLLRAASGHMAFAAGDMQACRYAAGVLEIDLPPAAPPRPAQAAEGTQAEAASWVPALRQAGIEAQATDTGWRLRRAPPAAGGQPAGRS